MCSLVLLCYEQKALHGYIIQPEDYTTFLKLRAVRIVFFHFESNIGPLFKNLNLIEMLGVIQKLCHM